MKITGANSKNLQFFLALTVLVSLSGCKPWEWITGGKDDAAKKVEMPSLPGAAKTGALPKGVLAVWGDGKVMITQKEFDGRLKMIMEQKPELKDMQEAFMPMLKAQLFSGLLYTKIIDKWVKEQGIDNTADYKKMLDQFKEEIKIHVNTTFFSKEVEREPSGADLKDYYEKNKDRIALISRGGVKAAGVKFENKAAAEAFLAKAKAKGAKFEKLVEVDAALKGKMQDFHLVNKQSRGVDRVLVKKILELKKFPSINLIQVNDKTFWVVNATDKEEEAYKPYKEVKETIYAMVKQAKQGEATQQKLDGLRAKYGVVVKENAFTPPQQQRGMMPPAQPKKGGKKGKIADAQDAKPLAPAAKTA